MWRKGAVAFPIRGMCTAREPAIIETAKGGAPLIGNPIHFSRFRLRQLRASQKGRIN